MTYRPWGAFIMALWGLFTVSDMVIGLYVRPGGGRIAKIGKSVLTKRAEPKAKATT